MKTAKRMLACVLVLAVGLSASPTTQPTTQRSTIAPTPIPGKLLTRRLLESRLAGTHWNCPEVGVVWTLNRDGTYTTTDGRGGMWAAIGELKILLRTDDGYVDEWTLNDALTAIDDIHGHLGEPWHATRADASAVAAADTPTTTPALSVADAQAAIAKARLAEAAAEKIARAIAIQRPDIAPLYADEQAKSADLEAKRGGDPQAMLNASAAFVKATQATDAAAKPIIDADPGVIRAREQLAEAKATLTESIAAQAAAEYQKRLDASAAAAQQAKLEEEQKHSPRVVIGMTLQEVKKKFEYPGGPVSLISQDGPQSEYRWLFYGLMDPSAPDQQDFVTWVDGTFVGDKLVTFTSDVEPRGQGSAPFNPLTGGQ